MSFQAKQKGVYGLFICTALLLSISYRSSAAAPIIPKIETPFFRFTVHPTNGDCEIVDKTAHVTWRNRTNDLGFGWVTVNSEKRYRLTNCNFQVLGNEL